MRRGDRLVALEVKAGHLPRPALSRGARSFLDAYRPACFGEVYSSLRQDEEHDGVPVRFIRPWELERVLLVLGR